jgi:uncharacterized protein YbjT (DUF2867 family)
MKAIVFGASGLTGEALTAQLLADPSVSEVVVFLRRASGESHAKRAEIVIDFDKISDYTAQIKGDVVFNCLGTTLAKAGSQAAQQRIDRDYPIAIAQAAAQNGVPLMVSVSSVGTADSGNFYLKTKAEMEAGVCAALGESRCIFMRPSMLMGDRKEFRLGEKIGIFAMYGVDYLLLGGLRKYRSMPITDLAKAMIKVAKGAKANTNTPEFDEIMRLANLV